MTTRESIFPWLRGIGNRAAHCQSATGPCERLCDVCIDSHVRYLDEQIVKYFRDTLVGFSQLSRYKNQYRDDADFQAFIRKMEEAHGRCID